MLTSALPTCLSLSGVIAGTQKAANRLQAAMDRFEAAGGYDADKRIANVLTGLGFKQEDWNKSCSEFSGGWQVFATLCIYAFMHYPKAGTDGCLKGTAYQQPVSVCAC